MKTSIGGERLGSGSKSVIEDKTYSRSSHDLGYIFRSSMSCGTLVPFMKEVALPGDSFDIDLECEVLTLPTVGPLFGSYKVQLDVFQIPMRLYNRDLMFNKLGIGNNMRQARLPRIELEANTPIIGEDLDNSQINPSCIFSYLGIRGLATSIDDEFPATNVVNRKFNAVPWLAYLDIYKNYYANKQEEIGAVIHNDLLSTLVDITSFTWTDGVGNTVTLVEDKENASIKETIVWDWTNTAEMVVSDIDSFNPDQLKVWIRNQGVQIWSSRSITEIFNVIEYDESTSTVTFKNEDFRLSEFREIKNFYYDREINDYESAPKITTFDLEDIDAMREGIMSNIYTDIGRTTPNLPKVYGLPFKRLDDGSGRYRWSKLGNQEGLLLKTYQSDLLNNWMNTDWLDGDNGINDITAIDTSEGSFNIDTLVLSKKIYYMLNRIAISGGSYDDWLDATYTHERIKGIQNPMYIGGLSKELTFQEVISSAATENNPLGTLAGRGSLTNKHKGGKIKVRIDEPSYIMGIVSLTPRLDYSQGNDWDVNLDSIDDLHKPELGGIGFQELITDQMAWWDTDYDNIEGTVIFKSAGKQPAWINYMTQINKIRGNFAIETQEMFMTLNRKYSPKWEDKTRVTIKDLTTYIDPSKFNNIFADSRLDAQNFWVQIKVDNFARRKMSTKVIPNL